MWVLDVEQGEHGQLHLLASPGLREVRLSHACLPDSDVGSDEVLPLPPAVVEACTAFVSQISHVAPDVAVFEIEFFEDPSHPINCSYRNARGYNVTGDETSVILCWYTVRLMKVNIGRLTDHPPHIVHADDLAFLFPLDLHHVIFKGCDIAVYDNLVREMSEAWPNIQTLHLSTIPGSDWKVSLPGLLPLVYRCRSLTELWVNLDATHVAFPFPITEIRPAFGSEQHSLRLLSVQYGRVADPAFVAGFLADCFPQCQIVFSEWGPAAAGADLHWVYHMVMWKKVGRLIPHFVKVRAAWGRHGRVESARTREPGGCFGVCRKTRE